MRIRPIQLLPWLILVCIVFATLAPIQFRPRTDEPAQVERFFAYVALGASFGLAFPRHWLLIMIGLPVAAYALELAQKLTPDRHWGASDVEAKIAGGLTGLAVGLLIVLLIRLYRHRADAGAAAR